MMLLVCILVASLVCVMITVGLDALEGYLEDLHRKPFAKQYGVDSEETQEIYGPPGDPMTINEFLDFWMLLSDESKRNYTLQPA